MKNKETLQFEIQTVVSRMEGVRTRILIAVLATLGFITTIVSLWSSDSWAIIIAGGGACVAIYRFIFDALVLYALGKVLKDRERQIKAFALY